MNSTYSISGAQSHFPRLVRETAETPAIAITRHDETVAYVVSREHMESIVETMETLASPESMRQIRDYKKDDMTFQPLDVLNDEG